MPAMPAQPQLWVAAKANTPAGCSTVQKSCACKLSYLSSVSVQQPSSILVTADQRQAIETSLHVQLIWTLLHTLNSSIKVVPSSYYTVCVGLWVVPQATFTVMKAPA